MLITCLMGCLLGCLRCGFGFDLWICLVWVVESFVLLCFGFALMVCLFACLGCSSSVVDFSCMVFVILISCCVFVGLSLIVVNCFNSTLLRLFSVWFALLVA